MDFALSPGVLHQDQLLDYSLPSAVKHYNRATNALDDPYDLSSKDLKVFLANTRVRCDEFAWGDIMEIPVDIAVQNGPTLHLLDHYAQVTREQIHAHCATYIDTESRLAQDNAMMYAYLSKSITKEGSAKVMLQSDEYTIDGLKSGPLFLKTICDKAHVTTKATCRMIRQNFAKLEALIVEHDYNIKTFVEHVEDNVDTLHAHGQLEGPDLITQLFKAFKVVPDKSFSRWITRLQDDYDDGIDIAPGDLLQRALTKFLALEESDEWNAPSEERQKIIALETQLARIEQANKRSNTSTDTSSSGTRSNNNSSRSGPRDSPAWMFEFDGPNKTVEGKDFIWCEYHKKYGNHLENVCNKKKKDQARSATGSTQQQQSGGDSNQSSQRLRLTTALNAVREGDEGTDRE